jgi:hypothetical protein
MKNNVPGCHRHIENGWRIILSKERFSPIVNNPSGTAHLALPDESYKNQK